MLKDAVLLMTYLIVNVCVPNKTEDLNLSVFNMIIVIDMPKILTKHISCKYKCNFDGRKCNWNQKWNKDEHGYDCKHPKEHNLCEKGYIWNPARFSCKNGNDLASNIEDSVK